MILDESSNMSPGTAFRTVTVLCFYWRCLITAIPWHLKFQHPLFQRAKKKKSFSLSHYILDFYRKIEILAHLANRSKLWAVFIRCLSIYTWYTFGRYIGQIKQKYSNCSTSVAWILKEMTKWHGIRYNKETTWTRKDEGYKEEETLHSRDMCVCALCSFVTTVCTYCNNSGPKTCHQGGLIFVQRNWQIFASHLEAREGVTEWDILSCFCKWQYQK